MSKIEPQRCPTCGNEPSHLELLATRVRAAIGHPERVLRGIRVPKALKDRLSDDPVFSFGFDGFFPNTATDSIAGSFRAAIYAGELPKRFGTDVLLGDWRYFICFLPSPLALISGSNRIDYGMAEYSRGDLHRLPDDLPHAPSEINALLELPDAFFVTWVRGTWIKFYDFVIDQTRELWVG